MYDNRLEHVTVEKRTHTHPHGTTSSNITAKTVAREPCGGKGSPAPRSVRIHHSSRLKLRVIVKEVQCEQELSSPRVTMAAKLRLDNNVLCAFVLFIHYLPLWPIILGKDGVVCVHCPICHQHNGLAADAAPPSLIELETDRERKTQS